MHVAVVVAVGCCMGAVVDVTMGAESDGGERSSPPSPEQAATTTETMNAPPRIAVSFTPILSEILRIQDKPLLISTITVTLSWCYEVMTLPCYGLIYDTPQLDRDRVDRDMASRL